MEKFLIFLLIAGVASQNVNPMVFCSLKAAGLFSYPGTLNCTQYIKCYLYSGVMNGAIYTCAGTTLFNPLTSLCAVGYVCVPQTTTTTSTLAPTTTTTSTLGPTTTSTSTLAPTTTSTSTLAPTTTSTSTLAPTTSTSTTTLAPTTTITSTLTPTTSTLSITTSTELPTTLSPSSFCSTQPQGSYEYPGTQNCTQYIKCYILNSIMNQATFTCAGSTLFNPLKALCEVGYVCVPQTTTTLSSNPTSSTSTSTTSISSTSSSSTSTSSTSTSSSSTSSTSTSTSTSAPTTTSTLDADAFCQSKAVGQYQSSSDCKQYVRCYLYDSVMYGQVFSCLGSTLFNYLKGLCEDGYVCVEITTTTVTTTTTTLAPADPDTFCQSKAVGQYPDSATSDCTKYVRCYQYSGAMYGQLFTCSGTTLFDPQTGLCSSGYSCGASVTTQMTTSTSTTVVPFDVIAFCNPLSKGYYEHPYNGTCDLLIYCYTSNGFMIGVVIVCIDPSTNSLTTAAPFDPNVYCSSQVVGYFQVARNSTCTSLVYCFNSNGIMVGSIIEECIVAPVNALETIDMNVWCSRVPSGDYPYPGNDNTCTIFTRCYEYNGVIYGEERTCNASVFDPETRSCNTEFICEE